MRTALGLRGVSVLPLVSERVTAQEIMVSRAFGRSITTLEELRQAVQLYAARACEKLRNQHRQAWRVSVWVATNPFRKSQPQYHNSISIKLPRPTDYTPTIIATVLEGLEQIYRAYPFHCAGVRLSDLTSADLDQGTLTSPHFPPERERALMAAIDAINHRYGRETIRFLGSGLDRPWSGKITNRSPRALTCWDELPLAHVG